MEKTQYATKDGFTVRLEARLKNAKLIGARESLGLTQLEAAERIGISYFKLNGCETLRDFPSEETQKKICKFYRKNGVFLLEEDVFPQELKEAKFRRRYITEKEVPRVKLLYTGNLERKLLPSHEQAEVVAVRNEFKDKLEKALSGLKYREQQVIKMRYGLEGQEIKTYREIGSIFGIKYERARQIEKRALEKLRHPAKKLTQFLELISN